MKVNKRIAGLGHYPTILDVKAIRAAGGKDKERVSEFPVHYQVETGMSPETMTFKAEGLFRVFGEETVINFPVHEARYVRVRILSNAGKESGRANYRNCRISIAELTLYKE